MVMVWLVCSCSTGPQEIELRGKKRVASLVLTLAARRACRMPVQPRWIPHERLGLAASPCLST